LTTPSTSPKPVESGSQTENVATGGRRGAKRDSLDGETARELQRSASGLKHLPQLSVERAQREPWQRRFPRKF